MVLFYLFLRGAFYLFHLKKYPTETFNTKFRVQYSPEKEKTDKFWPIFNQNVRLFPFWVTKEIQ